MRSSIAAAVIISLAAAGASRSQETVEIPYAPSVGSSWTIAVSRSRSTREGGVTTATEAEITARVSILTATAEGYDATWETLSVAAGSDTIAQGEVHPGLLIGVPLDLTLGFDGSPVAFTDWERVLDLVLPTVNAAAGSEAIDPQVREYANATIRSMGPELAARVLMSELAILAICQNKGLAVGEPLEFRSQVPNQLGGPPIDTINQFELVSVDGELRRAEMRYSMSLDPQSATASMRAVIEANAAATGRNFDALMQEFEDNPITNNTSAACVVDLDTGMTIEATYTVDVTSGAEVELHDRRILRVSPN